MHTIDTTVTIDAPPAAVWHVLTDFGRYGEWNPFIRAASGRAAVGETLELRIQPPGDRLTTHRPTVVAAEAGRRLAWVEAMSPRWLLATEHEFVLAPGPDGSGGRTVLRHCERFTGVLVPVLARTLRRTARGVHELNHALKEQVEGRTPA
jgi:hypothetical protein